MGDIKLAEVLQGFQNEKDFKTAKKLLLEFPFMDMIGQGLAVKSAMNLHNDKDFDPLEKHLKLKVMKS